MSTEDRLRDAARAVAATVSDVRPLSLPARAPAVPEPGPRRRPGPGPGRHWPPWLVPVAAAAAVIAVAAVLVAVRSVPGGRPSASPSSHAPSRPANTPVAGIPRYYIALNRLPNGAAGVGDTRSSRWAGTIAVPEGSNRWAGVTGAADDRTFILDAAQPLPSVAWAPRTPRTWYLLRIAPGTKDPARLTRTPIPPATMDTVILGMALSPGGTELALLFQRVVGTNSVTGPVTMQIYSVATGATLRTWTGPSGLANMGQQVNNGLYDPNTTLTWVAGGRELAFFFVAPEGDRNGIWLLDLSRPGRDLFADSTRVPLPLVARAACVGNFPLITADGQSAICGTQALPGGGHSSCAVGGPYTGGKPRFLVSSTVTGKLTRVLYEYPGSCKTGFAAPYWVSPSGDAVIGLVVTDWQYPGRTRIEEGLFTQGTFHPLELHLPITPKGAAPPSSIPYAF